MPTPQIARLLVAPAALFAERVACASPSRTDVVAALSTPTVLAGAAIALGYADGLLVSHYVGNVLLFAASFAVESLGAALVGRVLYRRGAAATLWPFALTLVPYELLFVVVTGLSLFAPPRVIVAEVGLGCATLCAAWNVRLTYALFRALGSRRRAALAVLLHFATIAVLVCLYVHALDLLPYPPGRP